ncbi:hypothetical protein OAN96_00480 [Candidatus Gracilibacteria bacterium]|nr:hypothetical protein [Candidatus Gracilibacteria bacterium]
MNYPEEYRINRGNFAKSFDESDFNSSKFLSELQSLMIEESYASIYMSAWDFGDNVRNISIYYSGDECFNLRIELYNNMSDSYPNDSYYKPQKSSTLGDNTYEKTFFYPHRKHEKRTEDISRQMHKSLIEMKVETSLIELPKDFSSYLSKIGETYNECEDKLEDQETKRKKAINYTRRVIEKLFENIQ